MEDTDRGRSLDRFEQSLKRLNPPSWIRQQSPLPPFTTDTSHRTRPRYSEHRRSYSAHRQGATAPPSSSTQFWRTTTSSREPSPGPGSRPATAAGRFQSSTFSRWSASTLCSDGQFSNGDNTPTDSVISAFSMRSSIMGTEPPSYPAPVLGRPPSQSYNKRPYLGWRSTDSLIQAPEEKLSVMTPAERLALSYRRTAASSKLPTSNGTHHPHQHVRRPVSESSFVHDSIKSVSTAIMEFCQAQDVPAPPPPTISLDPVHARSRHRDTKIVWLESSFISSKPALTVMATAAATPLHDSESKF